ncbi:serine/threonine-protein kinase [Nocardiopsis alba]|uniref:serine/threonine-protein kinase n=1 Tax=Nocardiopsis alba TaxID=53437 RepID=UPI0035DA311A
MPPPEHTTVGRYELRERLGVGGMGTVWRAWDPALQRDVAVKEVLLPDGMSEEDRIEAHARTMREARATARISHTAVVTVHDVLEHESSPWIVMELLSGSSSQQHIDAHGTMRVERVEKAARALLGGLHAAHAAGVTHRDVKPANIMLTEDERTVLTDFGIANVDGSAALTRTGVYIGSPEYMAPERFEGERALPASDLWSLGVTLYSLLEGRSPFKRDSITGMISAVLTSPVPPRLSRNEAAGSPRSAALRALIEALLTRDAAARPTPSAALELLDRVRPGAREGVPTRRGAPPGGAPSGGVTPPGPSAVPGTGAHRAPIPSPPADEVPTRYVPLPGTPPRGNPVEGIPAPRRPSSGTPPGGVPAAGGPAPPPRPAPPRSGAGTPGRGTPAPGGSGRPVGVPGPAPRRPAPPPGPPVPRPFSPRASPGGAPVEGSVSKVVSVPTEAARGFLDGVGYSASPPEGRPRGTRSVSSLAVTVMWGINAVAFSILAVLGTSLGAGTGWAGVVLSASAGLSSAGAAIGPTVRPRAALPLGLLAPVLSGAALGWGVFAGEGVWPLAAHALLTAHALAACGLLFFSRRPR